MRVTVPVKLRVPIALASLLLASAAAVWAAAAPPSDLQARRDALNELLAEQWEYNLAHQPGVRLDPRRQALQRPALRLLAGRSTPTWRRTGEFLARFEAIDTSRLPGAGDAEPGR